MEHLILNTDDITQPTRFAQDIFGSLAAGQVVLDFSNIQGLSKPELTNSFEMINNLGWDETKLRTHLDFDSMSLELQRLVLPIFGLKAPKRETPQAFSNNPFKQLEEIQNTYRSYVNTFVNIRNDHIRQWINSKVTNDKLLWNEPFLQLRRHFKPGLSLDELIAKGWLPAKAKPIFRVEAEDFTDSRPIHPHFHQSEALRLASEGKSFIVATGTGSGKSFAFGLPIITQALQQKDKAGIKAVIIYPMNALANSQYQDFALRLHGSGLKIALYTGDTQSNKEAGELARQRTKELRKISDAELWSREEIRNNPPDILMTNYVQLEYLLTRGEDRQLFPKEHKGILRYLVLDEVHTYAGKRGADVACLIRRLKEHTSTGHKLQVIGTSATVDSGYTGSDKTSLDSTNLAKNAILEFASRLFGQTVDEVIMESHSKNSGFNDSFLPDLSFSQADVENFDGSNDSIYALSEKLLGRSLQEEERNAKALGLLFKDYAALYYIEEVLQQESKTLVDLTKGFIKRYRPNSSFEVAQRELQVALIIGQHSVVARENKEEARIILKLHSFYSQGLGVSGTLNNPPELSIKGEGQLRTSEGSTATSYPMVFCRVCGQEYYLANMTGNHVLPQVSFGDYQDRTYYLRPGHWQINQEPLPESWLTEKKLQVKSKLEAFVPLNYLVNPEDGKNG